jgi:hypothetical protein
MNITNGTYGDVVQEKMFQMADRNRAFLGFESHTIYVEGGSPYTFITSAYQPYNEGKVFVLKIDANILFNDIKISKESIIRIDLKQ